MPDQVLEPLPSPAALANMTVADVVGIINRHWRMSVENIIQVGLWLKESKDYYGTRSDEWRKVRNSLPFSPSMIDKLISVSSLQRKFSTHPEILEKMPSGWGTLYEISSLDDKELFEGIGSGKIHRDVSRAEIVSYRRNARGEGYALPEIWDEQNEKEVVKHTKPLLEVRVDTGRISKQTLDKVLKLLEDETTGSPGLYVVKVNERLISTSVDRDVERIIRLADDLADRLLNEPSERATWLAWASKLGDDLNVIGKDHPLLRFLSVAPDDLPFKERMKSVGFDNPAEIVARHAAVSGKLEDWKLDDRGDEDADLPEQTDD